MFDKHEPHDFSLSASSLQLCCSEYYTLTHNSLCITCLHTTSLCTKTIYYQKNIIYGTEHELHFTHLHTHTCLNIGITTYIILPEQFKRPLHVHVKCCFVHVLYVEQCTVKKYWSTVRHVIALHVTNDVTYKG